MRLWLVTTAAAVVVMCLSVVTTVQASRILFLAPASSKSHKNFFMGIINVLADHGHQITMVSAYKPSKVQQNVKEVVLPDMEIDRFLPNLFSSKMAGPLALMQNAPKICSDALAKKEVQDLLNEEFDLILLSTFLSDCFLAVVHHLKVPYSFVAPFGLAPAYSTLVGNPSFPSFVINKVLNFKPPMSYMQRMSNSFSEIAMVMMMDYYVTPRVESECRQRGLCPDNMPSLNTLRYNSSLFFINSVKTVELPARPIVPAVIHLGGIHCRPSQPLPKDLEEWVEGAGSDGFIFFSLGSAVTPSNMPEEHRKTLVEVFGSLKQRVLWKWDQDTMEDLPPNVRLGKWLPQQDILGDSRLKLFITHGGLLSTLESLYHGVPVLGMPVFADQEANMMEVELDGWGRVLLWEDLTSDTLREKIQFMMTNKELVAEVARRSVVMKDQPQDPRDVAVYWVEYIIRHNGAVHLHCPITDMSWVKVYNVDVWAGVVGVVVVLVWLMFLLLRALCRCLCSRGTKHKLD